MLTNKKNGKRYIGQTTQSIKQRLQRHKTDTRRKSLVRDTIRKYGYDIFQVDILYHCDVIDLNRLEMLSIARWNTLAPNGYNLTAGGEGLKGYKPTEATRKLNSEKQRAYCAKHGNQFQGKTHTDKTKSKMSKSQQGKVLSEEHKENISKGLKRMWAENPDLKEQVSQKNKGRKHSIETRKQQSKSAKERWANIPKSDRKNPAVSESNRRRAGETRKRKVSPLQLSLFD